MSFMAQVSVAFMTPVMLRYAVFWICSSLQIAVKCCVFDTQTTGDGCVNSLGTILKSFVSSQTNSKGQTSSQTR